MHRLFVAIRPPYPIRKGLLDIMSGVANARWQKDDQLHITLRFVGELDRHIANDLADSLRSVRPPSFQLTISGIGCFERNGHVHTVWAGLQPHEALKQLHQKIDRACTRLGLPAEDRSYLPHITLARLNRNAGSTDAFRSVYAGLSSEPFRVDSFALFESHLGREGSTYHLVERYRLE